MTSLKLDRLSAREIHTLARRYFFAGFIFLPFLWLVNVIYLWPTLKREDVRLMGVKKYLICSMVGVAFWAIALAIWYGLFVSNRVQWGASADTITVIIPKGL
ncbi:uncharacterized protein VTP21DRAFT_490 [Calcarisporiella thermophila]|uniref:uncharacterized protein n=1 Tax=Calcarisporiella thermophila TaxID=911321 RepID=UPI0037435CBF